MEKLDRIQQLHQLFATHRYPIKLRALAERLECSEKNARRLIDALQDFMRRRIEFDPVSKGWAYAGEQPEGWQLPGLWLTANELQSMATLLHVLDSFGNGLLNTELKPVEDAVHTLLKARHINAEDLASRIRVLPIAHRALPNDLLLKVAEALLRRSQLTFRYTDYSRKHSTRTVSPQTLVYYRDNWYLDAWCYRSKALRTFALARIDKVIGIDGTAHTVSAKELEEHFGSSYGIFAGQATQIARLRFRAGLAREIAMQEWHPQQHGEWDGDEYVLSLPYSDARELVRDVMRFVPDVVVERPKELREMVKGQLQEGLASYVCN